MLFTFPSRYWFTIGRQGVFSLARWASQIPPGFHVSRSTRGQDRLDATTAYGAFTRYGAPFQVLQLALSIPHVRPTTPCRLATPWFGLFPLRSPLLGESSFLSSPAGTEMFQFPTFASTCLCVQHGMTGISTRRVSPFGHPRIIACSRLPMAFRSVPRPSSPPGAKASTVSP